MSPAGPVDRLRRLKHRAYLAYKPYRFPIAGKLEPLVRTAHRIKPPHFDVNDWPGTHLPHNEPLDRATTEPVPRRIYCFWTGPNPLNDNRRRGLDALRRRNPDIDVRLITPDTLDEIVLADHPLHPAYENLAYIHRADYLRCYVLHFHGGGYADIKPARHGWAQTFDRIDASAAWLAGYRVPVRLMGPTIPDRRLERKMVQFSEVRLGQCAYISRPQTPLSAEWWRELNIRLDGLADRLAAHPGDARGDDPDYPVAFTSLLAGIVDPLQVKYRRHLLYDERLQPELDNYL